MCSSESACPAGNTTVQRVVWNEVPLSCNVLGTGFVTRIVVKSAYLGDKKNIKPFFDNFRYDRKKLDPLAVRLRLNRSLRHGARILRFLV